MANEVKLITGASGTRHITPQDDASLIRGIVGSGAYILNDVQLEIRSNNTIVIPACDLIINGRHIRITNPKSVTIENGAVGNSRTDTIYLHYTNTGGIEDVDIRVNKGAGVSGRVEDFGTSSVNQFTLATVTLNGINITGTKLNLNKIPLQEIADKLKGDNDEIKTKYITKSVNIHKGLNSLGGVGISTPKILSITGTVHYANYVLPLSYPMINYGSGAYIEWGLSAIMIGDVLTIVSGSDWANCTVEIAITYRN